VAPEKDFPPTPHEREPEAESIIYVWVPPLEEPGWRTRAWSVAGLIAVVTGAAFAVAMGIYQLGLALNQMIQGFLGK
jgi:hypothetical protein